MQDKFFFGEGFHREEDGFNLTFGCVQTETHLFYSQAADGILGLTRSNRASPYMTPIYKQLKERHLIDKEAFTLCLGKDGGYFQLGGSDGQGFVDPALQWVGSWDTDAFQVTLLGASMNGHAIAGSEEFSIGVIDSGTTFTYIPHKLFNLLVIHFDWFCSLDQTHCLGHRDRNEQTNICFAYDESKFPTGPKEYFQSYPVLNFLVSDIEGKRAEMKWFASEYLYRDRRDRYCLAVEKFSRSNEVLLGGSFMRQNAFVFDLEARRIGWARARCNPDPNMVLNEEELRGKQIFDSIT